LSLLFLFLNFNLYGGDTVSDKRLNETIRVVKRPSNFVMLDKAFLDNPALSFKAKGILAYLLSKPDDWKVIVKDLVNHGTEGKSAIYSGLNELKEHGYYQKIPVRDATGRRISHWEGIISEVPMTSTEIAQASDSLLTENREVEKTPEIAPSSLLPGFQEIDNQELDNQDIENRERNNNYITNNNFTENDVDVGVRHVQRHCRGIFSGKMSRSALAEVNRFISAGIEPDVICRVADIAADNGKGNWAYVRKAVESLLAKNVLTVAAHEQHEANRAAKKAVPSQPVAKANRFCNFEQRNTDYSQYEKLERAYLAQKLE